MEKNPISKYLVVVSMGTLCLVGLSDMLNWDELLGTVTIPLSLICSLLVVAYSCFALRIGCISTVGNLGRIYHYTRKKEPIPFFFLFVLYLSISVMSSLYLASRLIGS